MKTNRYVIQSAVVLALVALLTVPQVVGDVDEERHQYQRPLLKLVTDSEVTTVSGQGTSGTAVQGRTEIASDIPITVATNASVELPSTTSTAQEASAVLTNANQVTPAVPVRAETVTEPAHEGQTVDMQILSTTDLHTNLVNYDYYQDKPSQTVGLSKTAVLIKKARETNPNTVLVDSGDTIQGTLFGTYKALIDPVAQGETHPMYKAFEMLGYDAETLGNHEFNYGLEFLDHMVKAAKINIINVNVRNAQTGDYYYNPYKIVNKTFTDTDSKQKVVNSKAKLEKNDTKSDIADKDLIDMAAYDHNGTSTQAGFAEYRLIVKEKANQVDDTTNKESEKSPKGVETTDQSKREISKATVVTSLAKSATTIQLLNSKVIIQPQA